MTERVIVEVEWKFLIVKQCKVKEIRIAINRDSFKAKVQALLIQNLCMYMYVYMLYVCMYMYVFLYVYLEISY